MLVVGNTVSVTFALFALAVSFAPGLPIAIDHAVR